MINPVIRCTIKLELELKEMVEAKIVKNWLAESVFDGNIMPHFS